jgi:hypothetical protein
MDDPSVRYMLLPAWELHAFVMTRLHEMQADPENFWKHLRLLLEIEDALKAETRH